MSTPTSRSNDSLLSSGCQEIEELLNFVESSVHTDELGANASRLRNGLHCTIGEKIWGGNWYFLFVFPNAHFDCVGFNLLFELNFSDEVTWLARIPLFHQYPSQSALDFMLCSYVSTLNYIKLRTNVPVPKVFACHLKSEPDNRVGVSYMLMERLPGHSVLLTNVDSLSDIRLDTFTRLLPTARSFHCQLSEYLMELASHPFDKIGSIQERPLFSRNFVVEEYVTPTLVSSEARQRVWNALPLSLKGPYTRASSFYSAIMDFNETVGLHYASAESDSGYLSSVRQCRRVADLLALPEFETGPFVIEHDDLSSANILVSQRVTVISLDRS
ncbi:hypothetical protein BU17DRAFT_43392 [Hysterangium stoloniferum]|nr:hypothetical protein BU17DRAFT_43392 [Hysterangium stoloniferum]